jgi:hypothetical protein
MAQTKRKRRSKHRGTAAGTVETRGRTGRKLSGDERKAAAGPARRSAIRTNRYDEPPSWRGAFNRALIASGVFFVAVLVLFKQSWDKALPLALFLIFIYIPMGYYTDLAFYRYRQRKKQQGGGA